jgi:AraC-like DNA-binding protein
MEYSKQLMLPQLINAGLFENRRDVIYHSHPGIEFIYLEKGTCQITVAGNLLSGKEGSLFVIPANVQHNQVNNGFVRTIYMSFKMVPRINEKPRILDLSSEYWIPLWIKQIYQLNSQLHDDLEQVTAGLVYAIIKRMESIEQVNLSRITYHPALKTAIKFIEDNVEQQISLRDIANFAMISPSYLSTLFKKQFKQSPIAYALELKIKYAERLLDDPYLTVKEVSNRCGFNDPNYFCRIFRKYHGCTPVEFSTQSLLP